MLLQGARGHHALRPRAAGETRSPRRLARSGRDQDAPGSDFAQSAAIADAQDTVLADLQHGGAGADVEAFDAAAHGGREMRAAPDAAMALPAEAEVAAVARNAAGFGFAFQQRDIPDAEFCKPAGR